jgi:hypothetical protein
MYDGKNTRSCFSRLQLQSFQLCLLHILQYCGQCSWNVSKNRIGKSKFFNDSCEQMEPWHLVLKTAFTFYFSFRNSRQWVFTFFSRMHDGLTHTRVRHMYVPTPTRSAREVHVGRWSLKSWVKLVLCFCLWRAQLKLAIQKLEIYSILVLSNCHSGMPRVKCYQQHSQLMCFTWTNS